jgi:signal transduction histidine kinase
VKIYQNDFVADKTEINLEGKTYRSISGEREYFEILIKTLVENAIKFTTDKRINPKIEIKELPDSSVVIKVSSYGRLIPTEERKDIFSRSYRSSVHKNVKGTGMG